MDRFSLDGNDQTRIYLQAGLTLLATTIIVNVIAGAFSSRARFLKSQPWARPQSPWFSALRAYVQSVTNLRGMMEFGNESYSQKSRAFVLPMIGSKPWLVLPASNARELINRPDTELDANMIHTEQIQIRYTVGSDGVHAMKNPIQFDVLRRQLTRKLSLLTPFIYKELDRGFREYWGTDSSEWVEVDAYNTCINIVTQAANRAFAGEEICRNKRFLEHSRLYTQGLFAGAMVLRLIPGVLKPILAPLVTALNRRHLRICLKICLPVVKDRIVRTKAAQAGTGDEQWELPLDALQWVVDECLKSTDPKESSPRLITHRLLMLNTTAVHTTSITLTQALFNIHSSPSAGSLVSELRQECDRVLAAHDGAWTKAALNDLLRLDSTIRESMRFTDLEPLAVARQVVHPQGIDMRFGEGSAIHVPLGVNVCLPAHCVHRDPAVYSQPFDFLPFRFFDARGEKAGGETASAVTTTDRFLAFGHGRHACPGRFFAVMEMKLMLAYALQKYDVERLATRPRNTVLFGSTLPDMKARIRVRRRAA